MHRMVATRAPAAVGAGARLHRVLCPPLRRLLLLLPAHAALPAGVASARRPAGAMLLLQLPAGLVLLGRRVGALQGVGCRVEWRGVMRCPRDQSVYTCA